MYGTSLSRIHKGRGLFEAENLQKERG